jgi:hypothetical protein
MMKKLAWIFFGGKSIWTHTWQRKIMALPSSMWLIGLLCLCLLSVASSNESNLSLGIKLLYLIFAFYCLFLSSALFFYAAYKLNTLIFILGSSGAFKSHILSFRSIISLTPSPQKSINERTHSFYLVSSVFVYIA